MNETLKLKYVYLMTTNVQILRNEFMFRELTDTCWILHVSSKFTLRNGL